ncbi:MAG: FadR/GntR family transcriptional regulator [Eubacteriales bacterium]|jgi:GntR family transcriptional repressor for pyruvate dehydrogenase complex
MSGLFEAIEKTSAAQQAANQLKQAIVTGQLPQGSRLPSERELAAQMGISRPALREAIVMLSSYGLVVTKQGEGNFVADEFPSSILSFMGFGSNLSPSNYQYFFQCRELFETGVAQLVVQNVTRETLQQLRDINQALGEPMESIQQQVDAEIAFHKTLMSIVPNPLIVELYAMVLKFMQTSASCLFAQEAIRQEAFLAHREIIGALADRDVEGYRRAMQNHLHVAQNNMKVYYEGL